MELKVLCNCGQKFKFDVEPQNGRMPFQVNCPVCNTDATNLANAALAEKLAANPASASAEPVPPPLPATAAGGLRVARAPIEPLPAMVATADNLVPPPLAAALSRQSAPAPARSGSSGQFNLGLGFLGAMLGAGLGGGLMYGFFLLANFRFPLLGTGIGLFTGVAARWLYRGRSSVLGALSAVIAVGATCGVLFLMYGEVSSLFFISIGVSGYLAYRLAS